MIKYFLTFLTVFSAVSAAHAMTANELKNLIGHYEGEELWNVNNGLACSVDITLNKWNQVVVSIQKDHGMNFMLSPATLSQDGELVDGKTQILKSFSYLPQSINTFLKNTDSRADYHTNSVKKFGFSTSENWLLDMSGFEKNDGFIRIEYRKIKTWQVYDSTISWFQETCGHLKKVSR